MGLPGAPPQAQTCARRCDGAKQIIFVQTGPDLCVRLSDAQSIHLRLPTLPPLNERAHLRQPPTQGRAHAFSQVSSPSQPGQSCLTVYTDLCIHFIANIPYSGQAHHVSHTFPLKDWTSGNKPSGEEHGEKKKERKISSPGLPAEKSIFRYGLAITHRWILRAQTGGAGTRKVGH